MANKSSGFCNGRAMGDKKVPDKFFLSLFQIKNYLAVGVVFV
jgi:hypothetical protein